MKLMLYIVIDRPCFAPPPPQPRIRIFMTACQDFLDWFAPLPLLEKRCHMPVLL